MKCAVFPEYNICTLGEVFEGVKFESVKYTCGKNFWVIPGNVVHYHEVFDFWKLNITQHKNESFSIRSHLLEKPLMESFIFMQCEYRLRASFIFIYNGLKEQ